MFFIGEDVVNNNLKSLADETGISISVIAISAGQDLSNYLETIPEIKTEFDRTSGNEKVQQELLNFWSKLSSSQVDKANTATEARLAYFQSPNGTKIKELAFNKWNNLSYIQAIAANSVIKAEATYFVSQENSIAKELALGKWINYSSTVSEIKSAYYATPENSMIMESAWHKWNELSMTEAIKAETFQDAMLAYYESPNYSEAEKVALAKMIKLYPR